MHQRLGTSADGKGANARRWVYGDVTDANAAYIAALSPDVVKELIALARRGMEAQAEDALFNALADEPADLGEP